MSAKLDPTEKKVTIAICLKPKTLEKLKAKQKSDEVSASYIIERLLSKNLKNV